MIQIMMSCYIGWVIRIPYCDSLRIVHFPQENSNNVVHKGTWYSTLVMIFSRSVNLNNSAPSIRYRYSRAWTPLVIKTRQLLSERESQSAMIICRVCARRFFQFPVMFTNNKKWRSTSWFTMFNSLFSFPTFLLFSPFRLVRSNTCVQWKHLTPERSIDLCLQTFPKLLLLLVPKVTTRFIPRMHC